MRPISGPEARFAVEVDSVKHRSSRYRFERDRRRDNALRGADIAVMRTVARGIIERSDALIVDITRALARRGGAQQRAAQPSVCR
jgi:very-short-patch-repair endonuclease